MNRHPVEDVLDDEDRGPRCLHCGDEAALVTGREVYPGLPRLWEKPVWRCPCGAYVGCHPGTTTPLGFPADAALRRARMILHNRRVDPLWRNRPKGRRSYYRRAVYRLLTRRLGLPESACHVSIFDIETCRRAWAALDGVTEANLVVLAFEDLPDGAGGKRPACPVCGKRVKNDGEALRAHRKAKGCAR